MGLAEVASEILTAMHRQRILSSGHKLAIISMAVAKPSVLTVVMGNIRLEESILGLLAHKPGHSNDNADSMAVMEVRQGKKTLQ